MTPNPTNAQELCDSLDAYGVACEACSFDATSSFCLNVVASLFKINESTTLTTMTPVAAADQTCLN